jgi:hypothetical protein
MVIGTSTTNATPRDKWWCAVYLRMTADAALEHGVAPGAVALLEQAAAAASEAYCAAKVEADELEQAMGDD